MRKHRFRPGAFFLLIQAGLLTGCVNHIENGEYISTGEIMAEAFANLVIGIANSVSPSRLGWVNLLCATVLMYGLGRIHGKKEDLERERLLHE